MNNSNDTNKTIGVTSESARLVLQLLDRLDPPSRRSHPATITVFRLYCVHQMSVTDIARTCGCSIGTVSNRLKLLRAATGKHPLHLRNLTQT